MKRFSPRKALYMAIVAGIAEYFPLGTATGALDPEHAPQGSQDLVDLSQPHPYSEQLRVLPRKRLHETSLSEATRSITVVRNFQELLDAWTAGAAHIELVSHMSSDGFPLLEAEINGGTFMHVLPPQLESTRTITGNCGQPPGEDITGVLSGEPLVELKDGQCVILGNQHLMPIVTGAVLVSNIYLRYNAPIQGSFVGEVVPQAAAVPNLFHSHGGKAWVENLTVQGDGTNPCGGIVVYSAAQLHFRDLDLLSLYAANTDAGPKPIALVRQASSVYYLRARSLNNKQDPGVPIFAGDSSVKMKFQECEFANNSLPLRIKVVPGAEVYSDNRTELIWPDTDELDAEPEPALPLSSTEGTGAFLTTVDPLYISLKEGTPIEDSGDDSATVSVEEDSATDGDGDDSIFSNTATIAISVTVSAAALLCACVAACLFLRYKHSSPTSAESSKNGRSRYSEPQSLRKQMDMNDRSSMSSARPPHPSPPNSQMQSQVHSSMVDASAMDREFPSSGQGPAPHYVQTVPVDPHAGPHALSGLHYVNSSQQEHPYYKSPGEPVPAQVQNKYDAAGLGLPGSHASFASAHSYNNQDAMHVQRPVSGPHAHGSHEATAPSHYNSIPPPAPALNQVSTSSMAVNSISTPSTQNTQNMRVFQSQAAGLPEPDSAMTRSEGSEGAYAAVENASAAIKGGAVAARGAQGPGSWGRGMYDTGPSSQRTYSSGGEVTDAVGIDINGGKVPQVGSVPPAPNASMHDKLDFLHCQLDSLRNRQVLSGLLLQDGGSNRLVGGQAIVQFATHALSKVEYAIKFFVSNDAFLDEYAQYRDSASPLRAFLPRARDIVPNDDGAFVDARGHSLPPCIVMEKGESLDRWVQRNRRVMDPFTCMQILYHVCECLTDLHSEGFAHRDLKPANVMWLPSQNRWTIIDFGCAAKINSEARMGFSLMYAAPEVVNAVFRQQQSRMIATTAMDAWSVGILAIELFTGRPALRLIEGRDKVVKQIVGELSLPWEGADGGRELLKRAGKLRPKLLQLLARDPNERLSVAAFVHCCSNMLNTTTQQSFESKDSQFSK